VGTGTAIVEVGRPILVSYVVAGLLLLGILYLLARMRKRLPAGLFITDFVHLGLSDVAECIAAWIYWVFWTLLAAIEALAGANILAPEDGLVGLLAAIALLALTVAIGEKRLSVSLSELEMGFAGLKVAIITAFILFTLFHVVGRQPSFALSTRCLQPLHDTRKCPRPRDDRRRPRIVKMLSSTRGPRSIRCAYTTSVDIQCAAVQPLCRCRRSRRWRWPAVSTIDPSHLARGVSVTARTSR
jgi:hypothetical protein